MSVVSLSILAYGLSGVLLALGLLPFWRDGGSRVDMRLLLAGVAVAVLSALFVFGDASTTRLLAIVAALGGGAVAGGLAVLRRNSRDAGELVPAAVAAIGAGVVLLAAAAFMTPDGLVSVRDGAIRARDLLMLALSAGAGAFCCSGGVVVALRKAGMTGGKLGPKVPVGMATGLVVLSALLALMLYAFSQPVALFWFVIGTGLSAGLMRFLPAEDATVERLSPVLVSAAGWAVAACGFMLSVLVLIIAGGLAGAAGAAMAWRRASSLGGAGEAA
jgi:NAD/NADP transhydrogenase beta subunit